MNLSLRTGAFLICISCFCLSSSGQQTSFLDKATEPQANANHLSLNVVITDKSGNPVRGLEAKDFQLFDNKQPQKVLSVESAIDGAAKAAPVTEVILVLDEVNTAYSLAGYEREGITRFLRQNGGKLPYPVTFAYFTYKGTSLLNGASTDGNALATAFEQHETGIRSTNQAGTSYGALEQFQKSITTLDSLVRKEGQEPGRKMILWLSPGWPLMAVQSVDLDKKEQDGLFAALVSASNTLHQAKVTLYSIDPEGMASGNAGAASAYISFLKPVQQAKNVEVGNLALQVLALHSGGLVLHSSNDIASEINKCLADANASYTLTTEKSTSSGPNQYHALEVKALTPGLVIRTLNGYYTQP